MWKKLRRSGGVWEFRDPEGEGGKEWIREDRKRREGGEGGGNTI